MNQLSASPAMSTSAQESTAFQTRLSGKPLVFARSIWAALVLFTLGLLAFNLPRIPHLLAQFQTPARTRSVPRAFSRRMRYTRCMASACRRARLPFFTL